MRGWVTAIFLFAGMLVYGQHQAIFTVKASKCHGDCSGSISTSVSGGVPPYSYLWSPGGLTTKDISNLCSGSYTLSVTDGAGSTSSHTISVTEPSPLTVSTTSVPTLCGDSTGQASASASGGTGSIIYIWDLVTHQEYGPSVSGLKAGTYCLSIIDEMGCITATCVYITSTGGVTASLGNLTGTACPDICNGTAVADTAQLANGSYTIDWYSGNEKLGSGPEVSALCPGKYRLAVTSEEQCTDTLDFTVDYLPRPEIDLLVSDTLVDNWYPEVTFSATATTGDVSFFWDFGPLGTASGPEVVKAFPEVTGEYPVVLTATNNKGCSQSEGVIIYVRSQTGIYVPSAFSPDGDGINDLFNARGFGLTAAGFNLSIFNRQGLIVFSSDDPGSGWDGLFQGKPAASGVYIWQVSVKTNEGDFVRSGHLTLVR